MDKNIEIRDQFKHIALDIESVQEHISALQNKIKEWIKGLEDDCKEDKVTVEQIHDETRFISELDGFLQITRSNLCAIRLRACQLHTGAYLRRRGDRPPYSGGEELGKRIAKTGSISGTTKIKNRIL